MNASSKEHRMVIAGVFGVVIGLAVGLLGAGGSILAVPVLVYGVGQPLQAAIPGSLLVVAVSAAGALLTRLSSGLIRWRIALVFGTTSIPGAFAGSAVSRMLPERWLLLGFAVLMAIVALRLLGDDPERQPAGACRTRTGSVNWRRCLPRALALGAGVGLLAGLFGVGGGFVVVPALTLFLGLTATEAVATSLAVIIITSLAGLAAHAAAATHLDHGIIGVFATAALLASLTAGRVADRLTAATTRRAFGCLLLLIAAGITIAVIVAPATLHTR